MQTAQEIQSQIAQVQSEMKDITRSLDRITDIQSMLGAKAELRDRSEVLDLLTTRLEDARKREAAQAEKDRITALEQERDDAKAEHDQLTAEFEAVMVPLERAVLDALDKLDPIAFARGNLSTRHADALYWLRDRATVWDSERLSEATGWFTNAEGSRSNVRRALFELYMARRGLPGLLKLDGQGTFIPPVYGTPPQQLTQPDTRITDALDFLDSRMTSGND